jgi:DNA-binding SARP family transcriptional activator
MVNEAPIRLRLLGGATLEGQDGPISGRPARRHVLALLARLAAAPGHSLSREALTALLWPETDPQGARRGINAAVYDARKALGADVLRTEGGEIRLDVEDLVPDVVEFDRACRAGDFARAVRLYAGPFLYGFHLPDAFEFEEWADRERERYARRQREALESAARAAEEAGDLAAAERWWGRLRAEDLSNVRVTARLMQVLAASGARGRAIDLAADHARHLREEYGAEPDRRIQLLRDEIMAGGSAAPPLEPFVVEESVAGIPLPDRGKPGPAASPSAAPAAPAAATRRWWAAGAAAVLLATLVVLAAPWRAVEEGAADALVPDRLVVLPFVVRGGDEYAYLGDGMAEILAGTLDGVGGLRTADPHAVLAFVEKDGLDPADPAAGERVAARFGAGRFVAGSIVESGGRIQVQAALYRADGTIEARGSAGAGGDAEFFAMVDELTRQLLAPRFDAERERMTRLAVTTSASMPALKAYLEGEARLRAGQFEAAGEAYRRATREDSTFALAWYRQAVAAEWAFQPHDAAVAVEHAVRMADRIPERDRLFLLGFSAYARGEADRAEALYERILDERPESVEAWLQLGEIRFHYAPSRGRTIVDSREAFERVLELDPTQEGARLHLARIAALRRDLPTLDAHLRWLEARDPESHATFEARGLRAFAAGDAEAARRLTGDLGAEDSYAVLGVLLGLFHVGETAGIEWAAELLARDHRPVEVRTAAWSVTALARVAGGRLAEAEAAIAAAERLDPLRGGELRAIIATLPFLEPDPRALATAREALLRGAPLAAGEGSFFLPDHDGVRPAMRAWLAGLLAAGLGDEAGALREARELERRPGPQADPTLPRDLAHGIRAEIHILAGRREQALAELDRIEEPPGYELVLPSPFQPRARERFLRARLLEDAGRAGDARAGWLRTGNRSFFDLPYRAPVQLRLAGLLERSGDRGGALEAYRQFVALWSRADPELRPLVDAARDRIGSLADTRD